MKVATYEYISVENWCRPVPAEELTRQSGNLVTFGVIPDEPPLTAPAFNVRTAVPDDIFASARERGMEIDPATLKKTPPPNRPFAAQFKNARVERPNFSVLVDHHLVLAESYHHLEGTEASRSWSGVYASRHEIDIPLDFGDLARRERVTLKTKFYLDFDIDRRVEQPCMLLSGTGSYNYHHWIMEMLPRLSWRETVPGLANLPLIVHSPLLPYQRETLEALGIGKEALIEFTGRMLHADTLFFPSYIAPGNLSIRTLEWVRDALRRAFDITPREPKELIYVSRRDAATRRVLNENEVIAALKTRGFTPVQLEKLSFREQLELFSAAKVAVMPHGAAGTNMIFAPKGASLIEIMPASFRHICYWVYATLNGNRYGRLVFDDSNSAGRQDMTVDVNALNALIDQALE